MYSQIHMIPTRVKQVKELHKLCINFIQVMYRYRIPKECRESKEKDREREREREGREEREIVKEREREREKKS